MDTNLMAVIDTAKKISDFTPQELLAALSKAAPAVASQLAKVADKLPPPSYNPYDYPKQQIGDNNLTRSTITPKQGGIIQFVLDFDTRNILAQEAIKLNYTLDEMFRFILWDYAERTLNV